MKTFEWTHQNQSFHGLETEVKDSKAALFVIHGMGEHIDRYKAFLSACEMADIYALGIDLRAHGKSLSSKGLGLLTPEDTFEQMIDDVHALFQEKAKRYPNLTWTLMGHSMGSVIARRYAQVYPDDFKRMIWMGTLPLYGWGSRKAFRLLAGFFSLFYPAYGRNRALSFLMNQPLKKGVKDAQTSKDWLSKNPENVERFFADPLTGYAYNSRFYRLFFKTVDLACQTQNIAKTRLNRLLLIAGALDPVTNQGMSHTQIEATYQGMFKDLTIQSIEFPDMRHEPLNETDPKPVYAAIIEEITHE